MKFNFSPSKTVIFMLLVFLAVSIFHPPWNHLRDIVDCYLKRPPTHIRAAQKARASMHPGIEEGYKYKHTIIPKDWNFTLSGTIEKGAGYSVDVTYYTENESRFCQQNFGIKILAFAPGPYRKTKHYSYHPEIENGRHSITIPLNEKRPDRWCKYTPMYVRINIEDAKGRKYKEDLFVMHHLLGNLKNMQQYQRQAVGKGRQPTHGVINAKCYSHTDRYGDTQICSQEPIGPKPYQNIKITQQLYTKNMGWKLNVDILSDEEQQELLEMWAKAGEEILEKQKMLLFRKNLSTLLLALRDHVRKNKGRLPTPSEAREIIDTKLKQTDPWGNPFQYQAPSDYDPERFHWISGTLFYSFGSDGIKSRDDITLKTLSEMERLKNNQKN